MFDDPTTKDTLESRLRAIETRLGDLESSDRMPFTSQRGGAYRVLDENGDVKLVAGRIEEDPDVYGVTVEGGVLRALDVAEDDGISVNDSLDSSNPNTTVSLTVTPPDWATQTLVIAQGLLFMQAAAGIDPQQGQLEVDIANGTIDRTAQIDITEGRRFVVPVSITGVVSGNSAFDVDAICMCFPGTNTNNTTTLNYAAVFLR